MVLEYGIKGNTCVRATMVNFGNGLKYWITKYGMDDGMGKFW